MDVQGALGSQGASGPWAPPGPRPSPCVLLFATGPVLQPLGRRLVEQGKSGPALLALARSEHGLGNWRHEEWGPGEDQAVEASACLPHCPEAGWARVLPLTSPALPHVSTPQGHSLQNSGFPGPPEACSHPPPHPPPPLCVPRMRVLGAHYSLSISGLEESPQPLTEGCAQRPVS